jgi:hypothetical protein
MIFDEHLLDHTKRGVFFQPFGQGNRGFTKVRQISVGSVTHHVVIPGLISEKIISQQILIKLRRRNSLTADDTSPAPQAGMGL